MSHRERTAHVHVVRRIVRSAVTSIRLERSEPDPVRKLAFRMMKVSYLEAAKIAASPITEGVR